MPNISHREVREKYVLYDNKICINEDFFKCHDCLQNRVVNAGYRIVTDSGDVKRT